VNQKERGLTKGTKEEKGNIVNIKIKKKTC
jgi:hypothetical protein